MSNLIVNRVQFGQSNTATNNFSLEVPTVPDGTIKLGRGLAGAISTSLINIDASGNIGIGNTPSGTYKLEVSGAASATNLALSGNVAFSGTGNRITGDFSNATVANRVMFQTSTTNGNSFISTIPTGTGVASGLLVYNNTDPDNGGFGGLYINNGALRMESNKNGSGTYLPILFQTSGTEKLRIGADTTGTITIGGTAPRIMGDFSNATITSRVAFQTSTVNGATSLYAIPNGTSTISGFAGFNNSDILNSGYAALTSYSTDARISAGTVGSGTMLPLTFYTGGSEKLRIETNGNVIMNYGTSTTGSKELGLYAQANNAASIRFYQASILEAWIAILANDGSLTLGTGSNFTTPTFKMSSQRVAVVQPIPLGYDTGAGGTVTQLTSKSTAVTINKPSGRIVTSNASLAANTYVEFAVNNSLVTAYDTVLVQIASGQSAGGGSYILQVSPQSGVFYVGLRNMTAGALTDTLGLNFTIIKGAAS